MASIVFNGHDLGDVTTALVLERGGQAVSVGSAAVPGSPRRVVTGVEAEPFSAEVKLMLRPEARTDDAGMSALRRRLRTALFVDGSGLATLALPDEPGLEWRGVYAAEVGSWDELFEDGETWVRFESVDPIAYGEERSVSASSFAVGGTYPAAPRFMVTAAAGSAVQVKDAATGAFVRVERSFAGGERVTIDCEEHEVWVDGTSANEAVTLYSDFFRLAAGTCAVAFEGAADFTIEFTERWI